jgi:hypothetical protein
LLTIQFPSTPHQTITRPFWIINSPFPSFLSKTKFGYSATATLFCHFLPSGGGMEENKRLFLVKSAVFALTLFVFGWW